MKTLWLVLAIISVLCYTEYCAWVYAEMQWRDVRMYQFICVTYDSPLQRAKDPLCREPLAKSVGM